MAPVPSSSFISDRKRFSMHCMSQVVDVRAFSVCLPKDRGHTESETASIYINGTTPKASISDTPIYSCHLAEMTSLDDLKGEVSNPPLLRIRPPRGFGSILASTTFTTASTVAGALIPYTSILTDHAASVIAKPPCCAGSNGQSQPAVSGAVPVAILEPSFSARRNLSKTFGHISVGPGLFCEL